MAKKKGAKASSGAKEAPGVDAHASDNSSPEAERTPQVKAAEAAVRRAEAELKKANEVYGQVRQQAAEQLKRVRETNVGEVIDGTLKLVKKHPGPGVLIAAAIGFFLGRLFRR
ncbi:MAG: hypothetical protein ABIP48_11055 [Planctomycetota bacterium]